MSKATMHLICSSGIVPWPFLLSFFLILFFCSYRMLNSIKITNCHNIFTIVRGVESLQVKIK